MKKIMWHKKNDVTWKMMWHEKGCDMKKDVTWKMMRHEKWCDMKKNDLTWSNPTGFKWTVGNCTIVYTTNKQKPLQNIWQTHTHKSFIVRTAQNKIMHYLCCLWPRFKQFMFFPRTTSTFGFSTKSALPLNSWSPHPTAVILLVK